MKVDRGKSCLIEFIVNKVYAAQRTKPRTAPFFSNVGISRLWVYDKIYSSQLPMNFSFLKFSFTTSENFNLWKKTILLEEILLGSPSQFGNTTWDWIWDLKLKEVLRRAGAERSWRAKVPVFVLSRRWWIRWQHERQLTVVGLETSRTPNATSAFAVPIKFVIVVDHSQLLALDWSTVYSTEAFVWVLFFKSPCLSSYVHRFVYRFHGCWVVASKNTWVWEISWRLRRDNYRLWHHEIRLVFRYHLH